MKIENPISRDISQRQFEQAGREGFVEDFIEAAYDDLKFMAMTPEDQELWIKLVKTNPSLIADPPILD